MSFTRDLNELLAKHDMKPEFTGLSTWHEYVCEHCKERGLYNNGDETNWTDADVETVQCWNCKKITILLEQRLKELNDKIANDIHKSQIEEIKKCLAQDYWADTKSVPVPKIPND